MLKTGDKVKLNIKRLEENDWDGLKNKKDYIVDNEDTIYIIDKVETSVTTDYPYSLVDYILSDIYFQEDELIKQFHS